MARMMGLLLLLAPAQAIPAQAIECSSLATCETCLTAGCGFYGSCISHCSMIADIDCYSGLEDAVTQCAAYVTGKADMARCAAASGISFPCSDCTSTKKADGSSCNWFQEMNGCWSHRLGLMGEGVVTCKPGT